MTHRTSRVPIAIAVGLLVALSALIGAPCAGALAASTGTPGAVSVLAPAYHLTGDAARDPDATPAFAAAIRDALASSVRYPHGPSGLPQAVVSVPAGSYRLNGLVLPSNVRLEVDAGAVLEPIAKPAVLTAADPIQLVALGSHDRTAQVSNVSIVGVGTADNALKARARPTYDGWDISGYFTVDLDPLDSGASNDYAFATLINVRDFLISDVYVVQNNTIPACTSTTNPTCPVQRGPYPIPTTARSAFVYKPSNQSGLYPIGPYYDPTSGTLADVYDLHGPYGFGPTQITAGHDLTFRNLFSDGGTTLRLETDDTNKFYGAELRGVTADHVVGEHCNRALALAAHKQVNGDVHVSDVTAIDCNDALVQSADSAKNSGAFTDTTVDGLTAVGGTSAQVPAMAGGSGGLWTLGPSVQPVDVHPGALPWSANVTGFACSGPFTNRSDRFTLDGVPRQSPPKCTP